MARAGATVVNSIHPVERHAEPPSSLVIVVGRSKTGPDALYAWMSLLIEVGGKFSFSAASAAAKEKPPLPWPTSNRMPRFAGASNVVGDSAVGSDDASCAASPKGVSHDIAGPGASSSICSMGEWGLPTWIMTGLPIWSATVRAARTASRSLGPE